MQPTIPLILTISLDRNSEDYFTRLRTAHYPKHRNYIAAHLTLFHRLPSGNATINRMVEEHSNRAILPIQVTGITNPVNGVAYTLFSEELMALHKAMQRSLGGYLIRRDRGVYRPHITVQHQVTALKAQRTASLLMQDFKPFTVQGTGIAAWLYKKGKWEPVREYPFTM